MNPNLIKNDEVSEQNNVNDDGSFKKISPSKNIQNVANKTNTNNTNI